MQLTSFPYLLDKTAICVSCCSLALSLAAAAASLVCFSVCVGVYRQSFVGCSNAISVLQQRDGRMERRALLQLRDNLESVKSLALDSPNKRLFAGYKVSFCRLLLLVQLT